MVQIPGYNPENKWNIIHTTYLWQSCSCNLNNPWHSLLSIGTAAALFNLKISPVATYRMQLIWQDLTEQNLKKLESTKAMFLKRVLCTSKYVPTRLASIRCSWQHLSHWRHQEDIQSSGKQLIPEDTTREAWKSCCYPRRVLPYGCHANRWLEKTKFQTSAYIHMTCYPRKGVHELGLPRFWPSLQACTVWQEVHTISSRELQ
jgi:hypothetical protein